MRWLVVPDAPARSLVSLARRLRLDLSPLREFRDFRLLLGSELITTLGTIVTTVAEFVPMVVSGLWGGAIADAHDRRRIVILSELGLCLSSVLLLVNALLPRPQVWVLYVAGALAAGLGSIRSPSEQAMINRVLPLDRMPAAFALQGLVRNAAMIAGPAAGGLTVASLGPAASYGVNVASFLLSLALLVRVGAVPRAEGAHARVAALPVPAPRGHRRCRHGERPVPRHHLQSEYPFKV